MKLRIFSLSLLGAIIVVCLTAVPAERSDATLHKLKWVAEEPLSDNVALAAAQLQAMLQMAPLHSAEADVTLPDPHGMAEEPRVLAEDNDIPPYMFGRDIIDTAGKICERLALMEITETPSGIYEGIVARGDTVSGVLEQASTGGVQHFVKAAREVFPLRSFREGQPYIVFTDPDSGALTRFEYEINDNRRLVVEGSDTPSARLEEIDYAIALVVVDGVISDSLFQTVSDLGENPQLAQRIVDLFGSEINFIRDLQEGDSFRVLIEKRYRAGEYKGYGRILAANFSNRGKTFQAFLFGDSNSAARYYNQNGESLTKTLLQAPLAVTRLTSKFTNSRKHPILGTRRPHLGVDYGAPAGTPVKCVGDGVVTRKGWAGGFGNQIIVKHDSGLESMYAHLSGYARGLKQGQKVKQGQVIGFVGSTGLSTGPHLDFRLRQNGRYIDPTKAINPRSPGVPAAKMAAFKKVMATEMTYLDGAKFPGQYVASSIVPSEATATQMAENSSSGKASTQTSKKKRARR